MFYEEDNGMTGGGNMGDDESTDEAVEPTETEGDDESTEGGDDAAM